MDKINASSIKLGKSIQKACQNRNLTQEELAEKLNISITHVGHLEQGRKSPSLDLLEKIAKVLKMKVRDIVPY